VVDAGVLAPEVGADDRVAWLDAVALAEEELAAGLAVEWPEAVPLDDTADVGAELVPVSEDDDEDGDGEHPATATTRMARTPKVLTPCFAPSTMPAVVPRTVI